MAFLEVSDETGSISAIVFPRYLNELNDIRKNSIVQIIGRVEKRFDKHQIVVNKIT